MPSDAAGMMPAQAAAMAGPPGDGEEPRPAKRRKTGAAAAAAPPESCPQAPPSGRKGEAEGSKELHLH